MGRDSLLQTPPPLKKAIYVTTSFVATHQWSDCPIMEVVFLRYPHRHVFHVKMRLTVQHNDREKEFFVVKRALEDHIDIRFRNKHLQNTSCEDIAQELLEKFLDSGAFFVGVYEDNENGGEVYL